MVEGVIVFAFNWNNVDSKKRFGFTSIHQNWKFAVPGGLMSLSAYWIIIWDMQHASIVLLSAIRGISVVIEAQISIWVLKEETTVKHFSAVMVVLGVILSRL